MSNIHLIVKNIMDRVALLKNNGESVFLENIYPATLELAFQGFDGDYNVSGHDCNYYATAENGKYYISGSMRYGNATITLLDGGKMLERERKEEGVEEDPYTRTKFKGYWMSKPMENIPPAIANVPVETLLELLENKVVSPFYIVFSTDFNYKNPFVTMYAKTYDDVVKRATSIWGQNWESIYNNEDWQILKKQYGDNFQELFTERYNPMVLSWK